jgi:quercetin dioxygenase-like cupin family protein
MISTLAALALFLGACGGTCPEPAAPLTTGAVDPGAPQSTDEPADSGAVAAPKPELANLLRADLAGTENLEIVVSRVKVPAGVELPKHYHPGEEFVFVMSGTVTLKLEGNPPQDFSAGTAGVVPLQKIHGAVAKTAIDLVVFRVHEKGKPVRVIVKPDGTEVPMDK